MGFDAVRRSRPPPGGPARQGCAPPPERFDKPLADLVLRGGGRAGGDGARRRRAAPAGGRGGAGGSAGHRHPAPWRCRPGPRPRAPSPRRRPSTDEGGGGRSRWPCASPRLPQPGCGPSWPTSASPPGQRLRPLPAAGGPQGRAAAQGKVTLELETDQPKEAIAHHPPRWPTWAGAAGPGRRHPGRAGRPRRGQAGWWARSQPARCGCAPSCWTSSWTRRGAAAGHRPGAGGGQARPSPSGRRWTRRWTASTRLVRGLPRQGDDRPHDAPGRHHLPAAPRRPGHRPAPGPGWSWSSRAPTSSWTGPSSTSWRTRCCTSCATPSTTASSPRGAADARQAAPQPGGVPGAPRPGPGGAGGEDDGRGLDVEGLKASAWSAASSPPTRPGRWARRRRCCCAPCPG